MGLCYCTYKIKNCSLSIVLTATDQKPQNHLKGDITHHHVHRVNVNVVTIYFERR